MGVHTGQDEQALGSPEKEDTIMMKRFIRRVTAFALSAMLLTAPMAQAQELMTPEGTWLSVEIVVTLGDGSQFSLDVTPVTTTLGSTVYWLDDSMLTDEERAALPNAQLRLVTDTGEIYSEMPLSGTGLDNTLDYPISVANPLDPTSGLTLMRAGYAAPMTEEEADAVLSQFGFETPAPTEEPIIEETPAPTEEPIIEETPIPTEEPIIEETPIPTEEPIIEETPIPTEEPIIEETPIPTEEPVIEETPIPTEEPVIEETPIPTEEPTAEPTVELPQYATVNQPETMLFFGANEWDAKGALNPGDVLFVNGYVFDESGRLWYEVADYRSMEDGWVIAEQVTGIDEPPAQVLMAKIDAETAEPERTPAPTGRTDYRGNADSGRKSRLSRYRFRRKNQIIEANADSNRRTYMQSRRLSFRCMRQSTSRRRCFSLARTNGMPRAR